MAGGEPFGSKKSFDSDARTYRNELESLSGEAVKGNISRDDFIKRVVAIIALYYLLALLDGADISESEMTSEEQLKLTSFIFTATGSVTSLADDIYSGAYSGEGGWEKLDNRLNLWDAALEAIHSFFQLLIRGDPYIRWVWNPDKDHCFDCARLNGQVHRASAWKKSGYYPKSYDLECRGFWCGCKWEKSSGPSVGEF